MTEEQIQELAREYRAIKGSRNSGRRCAEIYAELEAIVGSGVSKLLKDQRGKKAGLKVPEARMLKSCPGYSIDSWGVVRNSNGEPLKHKWSWFKHEGKTAERLSNPMLSVKIGRKERSVYWLLVEAEFLEHPRDTQQRRTEARAYQGGVSRDLTDRDLRKMANKYYNDTAEAIAEDPELFGDLDPRP